MQHSAQIEAASNGDGTYSYDEYFAAIKPYIENADYAVVNLETPLGGKPYTGYPCFSAPESYLTALTDAGFADRLTEMPDGLDTMLYKDFGENGVEVSGGEAQKIAIARALYKDAPFIILDEPTAGLDPVGREGILANIEAYRQAKNATIMMVSHSMNDVARLTDRLLVLNGAKIAMDGTPEEVFTHAAELEEMGLDIPEVTRVFLRLQALGLDVPAVHTMEQAVAVLKKLKEEHAHA